MNLKGFDLNLLVALDTLLTERSVTRAADRLHITQPAMSNALQRIRNRFGDTILERSGRELRLTPVAEELIVPVRALMADAERLLGLGDGFEPSTATRTFRVCMSDYCSLVLLPVLTARVMREAPGVHLVVESLNEHSFERLCARKIDFCVSAQDLLLMDLKADDAQVKRDELFVDRLVSVVSAHRLDEGATLTREEFLRSPHVVYRSGMGTRALEERARSSLGIEVESQMISPTLSAMPLVVAGTDLVATLPSRLMAALRPDGFRVVPCPIDLPELVETLFWHPLSEGDQGHQWMRELIIDASKGLGPSSGTAF